jgi:hypothetical protein
VDDGGAMPGIHRFTLPDAKSLGMAQIADVVRMEEDDPLAGIPTICKRLMQAV